MKQVRLLPLPVEGGAGDNSEGSLSNPENIHVVLATELVSFQGLGLDFRDSFEEFFVFVMFFHTGSL